MKLKLGRINYSEELKEISKLMEESEDFLLTITTKDNKILHITNVKDRIKLLGMSTIKNEIIKQSVITNQ